MYRCRAGKDVPKDRLSPTYLLINTPFETLLDTRYGRAIASSLLQSLDAFILVFKDVIVRKPKSSTHANAHLLYI